MNRLLVFPTLLLLVLSLLPAQAAPPAPTARMDPGLRLRLETAGPDEAVPALVILREQVDWQALQPQLSSLSRRARHERVVLLSKETAARTQAPLLAYLEQEEGRVRRVTPFWAANVIGVQATPAVLYTLASRPDVAYIQEDRVYTLEPAGGPAPAVSPAGPEIGLERIGAVQMWERGWTGEGVLVATVDTGAWLPHPAIGPRWRGYEPGVQPEEAWFDYWSVTTTPSDTLNCGSHGTHVMGIMVGDDGAGNQIGVAPGAHWIAARIFGPPGSGCSSSDSSKLAAWQWLLDPDGDPSTVDDFPQVINRSGGEKGPGGGGYCRPTPDPIWTAITAISAAGATVFFGAGNEGPDPESIISWASQIESPIAAFSVGNVNGYDPSLPIRASSSRGPSPCDHATIKPEVVAPGVTIKSSVIPNPAPYGYMTGTSMSTPHVSGAAAILWQAFPYAGPERLQYALLESSQDLGPPGEDNDYGMGIINLPAAYHYLFDLSPSVITASAGIVQAGERLTYTIVLENRGQVSGTAALSDTLPAGVDLITASLWASNGEYGVTAGGVITWGVVVTPTLSETLRFAVLTTPPLSDTAVLTNTALLDDGLVWLSRTVTVTVVAQPEWNLFLPYVTSSGLDTGLAYPPPRLLSTSGK